MTGLRAELAWVEGMQLSPEVQQAMHNVDSWDFSVFELERVSNHHPILLLVLHVVQRFELDAFAPDPSRHARALDGGCVAWEGVVGPGELVFIPAEWPHAVENLDETLAISYNFVDAHTVASFARFAAPPPRPPSDSAAGSVARGGHASGRSRNRTSAARYAASS